MKNGGEIGTFMKQTKPGGGGGNPEGIIEDIMKLGVTPPSPHFE